MVITLAHTYTIIQDLLTDFLSLWQLKEKRVIERANAIKNGLIPDPSKPMRLADAIDFRGTLQHMCSRFEQVEREVQNMLDPLEMVGCY